MLIATASLLLILMALPGPSVRAVVDAESAPVHGVSVAVRSTRSVRYHGIQVPLFENIGAATPGRHFFPPLALLDCNSTRIMLPDGTGTGEENSTKPEPQRRTLLQLTVLLWTDEFLSAAVSQLASKASESSVASAAHFELMPLTELTLNWSRQAGRWLGDDYKGKFQLLDGWHDAQKPRARATFTVACNMSADCRMLLSHLSDKDGSAGHLFDLRYRIRCDRQQRLSVTLASRHLHNSPLFQQLDRFGAKSSGIILVSEATVNQLSSELRKAALDEMQDQSLGGQQVFTVDSEAMAALLVDAERLLRRVPIRGVGPTQWVERVFWQPSTTGSSQGEGLRPDRLAELLNQLLKPDASGRPGQLRPVSKATEVLAEMAGEGDLPAAALSAIRGFLAARQRAGAEPTGADEVRELAANIGSAIIWDTAGLRFVPSPSVQLYELNTGRLLREGIFSVRNVVLRFRVSEQRDHVTPLCRAVHGSADYSEESWSTQADLMRMRLQPLLRRAANVSAELSRLEAAFATTKADAGQQGQVQERSGDAVSAPSGSDSELRSTIEALMSRIQTLSDSVTASVTREATASSWQGRFADSFCVLANTGPPPSDMTCRTISFVIPKAALRSSLLDKSNRIVPGTAGQTLIRPMGDRFYRVQLRGCCK